MSVASALAELPRSIRVGPCDIKLVVAPDHSSSAWGYYEAGKHQIVLFDSMCDTQKVVEVVIHETAHAIYDLYKMQDGDQEERVVATMSIGWVQVYRDNPWLTKWIGKHVK